MLFLNYNLGIPWVYVKIFYLFSIFITSLISCFKILIVI